MSASKLVSPVSPVASIHTARLNLSANTVRFRKNGIEFHSAQPFTQWAEMTVDLQSPKNGKKLRCTGIVVACTGNRHGGYWVSLLFTGLSKQSQERLTTLAYS